MALLELKNIHKTYYQGKSKVTALEKIDLVVEKGEFTTIFGPSGSGKTTLLNIISCLDKPTSGTIFINGVKLSDLNKEKLEQFKDKNIGYISQSNNFITSMTVYENVESAGKLLRKYGKELKNRVIKVLQEVGLDRQRNKKAGDLSSDQKKRLAIAMVMIKKPVLVLADEPTINLDSKTSDEIMEIMVKMNENLGVTFIYSTYILQIMDYAYKIIGIQNGKLTNN